MALFGGKVREADHALDELVKKEKYKTLPKFIQKNMKIKKWSLLGFVTGKTCNPDARRDCAPDQQITEKQCLERIDGFAEEKSC